MTFTEVDSQTLVTLTHTGWERFADPAAARAEYDEGWPVVLGRYREHTAHGSPDADGETWVALLHRPGPAAPEGAALFDDPRFEEHLSFLIRMRDAGYLVAAGSLSDVPGEGMTILRLPGSDQLGRATELATTGGQQRRGRVLHGHGAPVAGRAAVPRAGPVIARAGG